jgi:putative tryptophan/tyrosine transport system substrate-binding protein
METCEVGVSDGKLRLRRLRARPQVEVTTARARIRAGEEVSVFDIGRREFIALLGGAAVAWPLAARAQQAEGMRRIGYLGSGPASAWTTRVEALRAGLRELSWVEGKNIVIEFRWADKVDELPALAAALVRLPVDVIFANSSTQVEAARQATQTIPIVFSNHADPVGIGHVASLARPGGNITGLSMLLTDLAVKELEILTEAVPQTKRIGVLWNPTTPSHAPAVRAIEGAAEKLSVHLVLVAARADDDLEGAFATMVRERAGGFLAVPSPLFTSYRAAVAGLALKHRLPGMFGHRDLVGDVGALMSYGANIDDLNRRASLYIDKILKGAKPADLPVEQASKYQLVINLKTAKALGLEIPPTLLARADEVIE